ncbi:MAG: hypothetical protein U1F81_11185 [Verrucomicrobiaceae bacterium]
MQLAILILITATLPIAWFVAEFRASIAVRRTLGVITILWSFGVAALVGILQDISANSYFTAASKELLEGSVQQLRAGKTEAVLREWSRANDAFSPTYENRGRYLQIVQSAIEGMKQ